MNGKKARNLRKLVANEMPQLPERNYRRTNVHNRLYPNGRLDTEGKPSFDVVEVCTMVLAGCQRKAYKGAKKLHHLYQAY